MKHVISFAVVSFLGLTWAHSQDAAASAGVSTEIPAYAVEGMAQSIDKTQTGVIVSSGGKKLFLPPSANTFLWKQNDSPAVGAQSLVLRDGRLGQVLLKIDPSSLPKDVPVDNAVLHFQTGSPEKSGNATFSCYLMLVDWLENATWLRPDPTAPPMWNGLRPGIDFKEKPFATFEAPTLKKGDMIEIPGFADVIKSWRTGKTPNYGFLLTLSGQSLQISIPSRQAALNARIGGAEKPMRTS